MLLDLRHALRVLRNSPGFTAVAIVTLMLGIGANVVVFGVLNAVLLRPLAVDQPQSLYQLRHQQWSSFRLITTSYPAFEDYQRRNTTLSGLTGIYGYSAASASWERHVLNLKGNEVTANYFDVLGIHPQLGRFFHADDEHGPGSAPYLVLSDSLWRRAFDADPAVVGKTVELNQHPFTVIGVVSSDFHGTERFVWADYWIPIINSPRNNEGNSFFEDRASVSLTVIGRLKAGVTSAQATADLSAISAALAREYPRTDDGLPLRLIHPGLFGDESVVIRGFLWSVITLALLVLGAACANLASLFGARATDRGRELALRLALGSSRWRLVRQLLSETALVSILGGSAGLAAAYAVLRVLDHWTSPYGRLDVQVDARVYLAALGLTVMSTLLSGLAPAWHASVGSPLETMKEGLRHAVPLRRLAWRDLLLLIQIAICTLLVTASFVAVRGMTRMLHTPLGIRPQGVVLVEMKFTKPKEMIEATLRTPGVTAAGTVSQLPMLGGLRGKPVYRPGTTEFTLKNYAAAPYLFSMSPGYFEAAGTRLRGGRDATWQDTADRPSIAIVNQTFAREMWGAASAIGQHFLLQGRLTEVVGIVEDGKYHDLTETPHAALFVPFAQSGDEDAVLIVRSQRPFAEMTAALERTLRSIQPDVPISVRNWVDDLQGQLFPAHAATVALGVMGLLAAMLAITGIFGMAAYSVSKRMKELGIRVALGADKVQLVSAAVGRPVMLLAMGSVMGLLMGFCTSRLMSQIVYQANLKDPFVVVGAVLTMALLGFVASAIPTRRALSVDPAQLMREQ